MIQAYMEDFWKVTGLQLVEEKKVAKMLRRKSILAIFKSKSSDNSNGLFSPPFYEKRN